MSPLHCQNWQNVSKRCLFGCPRQKSLKMTKIAPLSPLSVWVTGAEIWLFLRKKIWTVPMIVQFNIMHSMNLSYLNFEENFLAFFSISLPNFLIFLVVSALMFLFRFSLFMSRWLSANWCFCAFLLLSSFWFIWFFCQCPSECWKDPSCAIFLKSRRFEDIKWYQMILRGISGASSGACRAVGGFSSTAQLYLHKLTWLWGERHVTPN